MLQLESLMRWEALLCLLSSLKRCWLWSEKGMGLFIFAFVDDFKVCVDDIGFGI